MSEANRTGKELLHTPGGVRDVYGLECMRKLTLEQRVHEVMKSYGFHDIATPTFEFFDIFSKERGTVQSKEMFKFFDRGNNTLVLRPDMTPSIARCVAKYFKEETLPIRLCYTGQTFVNTDKYQGKLQEVTQVGAELFQDDTSDSDAEMIALMAECLLTCGLKEFQIEVGHAGIFKGLIEEAGFDEETAEELRKLIVSKNFFGVEEFLEEFTVAEPLKEIFLKLPELLDNLSVSSEYVKARTKNEEVLEALERLRKVEEILEIYGFSEYITVDFSMLSGYSYYTGVIFRAYTYGNGEALATGGRYDKLVKQFGVDMPAIGLVILADQLMLALSRQNLFEDTRLGGTILLYPPKNRNQAIRFAGEHRKKGKVIRLLRKSSKKSLEEYKEYARRMGAEMLLYYEKGDEPEVVEMEAINR